MINYNEINDFIIKVFNYYNGRINIINKAVLDINWCNLIECPAGGYSKLPNIVIVNPMVILRFFNHDEFSIKMNIIETIIHELYHSDQLINYNLYMSDKNYNTFIENACEVQTFIYITGHLNEVSRLISENAVCSCDKVQFDNVIRALDIPGVKYQRRYFYDHIFMCIDDICDLDKKISLKVYEFIKNNVINRDTIIININDEVINICANKQLITIDEFNSIMMKFVCSGVHNVSHSIGYNKDTNTLIVTINTEIVNLMCKKV